VREPKQALDLHELLLKMAQPLAGLAQIDPTFAPLRCNRRLEELGERK
jgi:hypothetical protein